MKGLKQQLNNSDWKEVYNKPFNLEKLETFLLKAVDKIDKTTFTFLKYCPHQDQIEFFHPFKGIGCRKCYHELNKTTCMNGKS